MGGTLLKWIASLAIGAFFVWLSARDGRFDRLAELGWSLDGFLLVGGEEVASPGPPARTTSAIFAEVNRRAGWVFDLRYGLLYLALLSVIHVLRVVRWQPLLSPLGRVPWSTLNRVGAVGFMCTFLFPLRLGELVRPYLLSREHPELPLTQVLATIVVERLVDGLVVAIMLYFVLNALPSGGRARELELAAYLALGIFFGALVFLGALFWQRERTVRLLGAVVGRFSRRLRDRTLALVGTFIQGLSVLPRAAPMAAFVGITVAYWLLNGVALWAFARGFSLDLPIELAFAMMSCVVVGMMIPNSPGNVGSFWYFLLLPLGLYGVGAEVPQVTVFGLAVYAAQLVQQTAFGLWFLATGRVRARELVDASALEV